MGAVGVGGPFSTRNLDRKLKCVSEFQRKRRRDCSNLLRYLRALGTRVATTTVNKVSSFNVVFFVICRISNSGISFNCSS